MGNRLAELVRMERRIFLESLVLFNRTHVVSLFNEMKYVVVKRTFKPDVARECCSH